MVARSKGAVGRGLCPRPTNRLGNINRMSASDWLGTRREVLTRRCTLGPLDVATTNDKHADVEGCRKHIAMVTTTQGGEEGLFFLREVHKAVGTGEERQTKQGQYGPPQ